MQNSVVSTNTNACNLIDNNDHFFFISNNYFKYPSSLTSNTSQLVIRNNNISSNGGNIVQNNTMFGAYTGSYGTCNNCVAKSTYSGMVITFHYSKSHEKTKVLNNVIVISFENDQSFISFGSGNGSGWQGTLVDGLPSSYHPEQIEYNIFAYCYYGTCSQMGASSIVPSNPFL